ncbi:MAG: hypothetical protein WBD74_14335 [Candidatus Aquilonibacter sp.]
MSSGDFETELEQSVQDHLAFIANAAKAAKTRIGQGVDSKAPAPPAAPSEPRAAVDFSAPEPDFDPAFAAAGGDTAEADAFAAEPAPAPLPEGAIAFDDLAVEGDDEGIPVWEDPP